MPLAYRLGQGCFNPRTREGATAFGMGIDKPDIVSIHAPVRVRPTLLDKSDNIEEFQSTHP